MIRYKDIRTFVESGGPFNVHLISCRFQDNISPKSTSSLKVRGILRKNVTNNLPQAKRNSHDEEPDDEKVEMRFGGKGRLYLVRILNPSQLLLCILSLL